ncbi:MAG: Flp pilus assembly complex ATPase component TadA [Candidatus Omnitrophica bacterium]|nr:Flp pilus assembly complex ATPase component TadA [Candidatus Omnitrophota bacterium]
MDRERIEFENEILNKLSGKIFLLQDLERKQEVIFEAFLEVYNSSRFNKFIKKNKGLDMRKFFNEFLSYGVIDDFLDDLEVEDIMINSTQPIYIHKTTKGLMKTEKKFNSREELDLFIRKLIIFSGRQTIKKINNVELSNIKGRVNIVYSPFGPQITITRAKERPLSITELIQNGTLPSEIAAQLWMYVEGLRVRPANIIIAGGPGAGKTTLLNAILSFFPSNERTVVIEDILELNTRVLENCSRLESDEDVNLADLVKNSLRMRPDRVIVGEVRGKEAQDLMTAMNIGKYCMGTLHASTARETILRLENEPMCVPSVLVSLVDVIVIMRRFNSDGKIKRVVGELVEIGGMEQKNVLLSSLWNYDLSSSIFHESIVSSIYRDKIANVSGRTSKEIMEEIKIRKKIIDRVIELGIFNIDKLTKIFQDYSDNPKHIIEELGVSCSQG